MSNLKHIYEQEIFCKVFHSVYWMFVHPLVLRSYCCTKCNRKVPNIIISSNHSSFWTSMQVPCTSACLYEWHQFSSQSLYYTNEWTFFILLYILSFILFEIFSFSPNFRFFFPKPKICNFSAVHRVYLFNGLLMFALLD